MLFSKLDREKIGETVLRLPIVSFHAQHKKVQYTVKDYFLPSEDNLEGQFVRDLFIMNTEELIDKWFDGEENAREIMMNL
ncbi:hypothetical protein MKY20_23770 [Cytobacillus sp. FSL W8-0315]|uniref:hypothetical protein n=1 Tax=Cytobacillus sp. FSL W8-0315 TaxID=2921600 RepID=UPI0030FA4BE0